MRFSIARNSSTWRARMRSISAFSCLGLGEAALAHDVDLLEGPLGRKSTIILGLLFGAQTRGVNDPSCQRVAD